MNLIDFFKKSIAARITLLVVLVVTIILLGGGIWQMYHVRGWVENETRENASKAMRSAIQIISNRISNVETAVGTAAAFADKMGIAKVQANHILKNLIESNKDITAVTLLYSENFFPEEGRYYAPTILRNPYTNELEEEEIGGPAYDFSYLETDSNWIYTNKLESPYWCLPYIDSISTRRAMITYSVPLHDKNNNIYAVLCADVGLLWVNQIVEEAKPYSYAEADVVSRDGQYISKSTHVGKNAIVLDDFVDGVQWKVSFTIPYERIMLGADMLSENMLILLLFLLVTISIGLFLVIRYELLPLKELAKSTRNIAKGDFVEQLPDLRRYDEVGRLHDSFEEMQHSLAKYIDELKKTTASKASIESELRIASDIQKSMLPKIFPPYPNRDDVDVYGMLSPAKAVGGDLFDFFIREEKLFFCIGDVSGKGVPASLVMSVARTLFRMVSMHADLPSTIITSINDSMSDQNDSFMFVTFFVGVLDLKNGLLKYCNAGHDAPVLIGKDISFLPIDSNFPIGVQPAWQCETQQVQLEPQATIFLYTDGLTDAVNAKPELFGEEKIMQELQRQKAALGTLSMNPKQLISNMKEAVATFVDGAEPSDDLTMLAITYRKLI
ncbi:MAG: SpoIIE family protein phosphatase [Bacteroidaceae bacterium]|nr:SpoIIE family protein phosphatase [Bacteroidaceae bacterium]